MSGAAAGAPDREAGHLGLPNVPLIPSSGPFKLTASIISHAAEEHCQ